APPQQRDRTPPGKPRPPPAGPPVPAQQRPPDGVLPVDDQADTAPRLTPRPHASNTGNQSSAQAPSAPPAAPICRKDHPCISRYARILAGCQSVLAIRTFWPMPGCSAPVLTVREPCVLSALYIADLHI